MNTLRLRYAVPNLIERITNRKALDRATRKASAANRAREASEQQVRYFVRENAKLSDLVSKLEMQIRMTETRLSYGLTDLAHERAAFKELKRLYQKSQDELAEYKKHLPDERDRHDAEVTGLQANVDYWTNQSKNHERAADLLRKSNKELRKEVARKETVIQNYQAGYYN